MAFNYDPHDPHTTNSTTSTRSTNNFDAPLIGDLKLAPNHTNTMTTPILYNDEPDPLHHSMDNNQFYDHEDMSTFGMTIDGNMYGSPSLGFDHLTTPITMPAILNLDTSPPPHTATFAPNNTNNTSNPNEEMPSTDTNHNNNVNSNPPPAPITPSFDDTSDPPSLLHSFDPMDMEPDTYYHSYNEDPPMFDTLRSCFSTRSEFGLDPIDQSTINVVSDGISQFLTPNSHHESTTNANPSTTYPLLHTNTTNSANNATTNSTTNSFISNPSSNYPILHPNPFGTPPTHRTIHHHIPSNNNMISITNHSTMQSIRSSSSNTSASSSSASSSASSSSASSSSSSSSASSPSSKSSLSSSASSSSLSTSCTMEMEVDIDMTPTTDTPPPYQVIKRNVFVSRQRRSYQSGYQYKCDCHYTANGDDCDKNSCFNKLFYYECVSALSCSVEDETGDASLCSNRKFQRGEWKKVKVQSAGRKGWGLYADEDIKCGDFVIEYVGEVIDDKECTKRLASEYLQRNKFYLLKLGGGKTSESIDATTKGGPGRFMNHSCEPNCKAQKWTVGGELCLGFFADQDIHKGEELTFDYQFQRYGAIRQKCYCGSVNCRKYLGAATHNKSPNRYRKSSMQNTVGEYKKRTYKKNKKIVKRNMEERIVVKQWYDDLMKLSDIHEEVKDAMDESDHVANKCMAKGRLLRRQYINTIAHGLLDEFKNGSIDFDETIRSYADEEEDETMHDANDCILREPGHADGLVHIGAIHEFETMITKQYENGCDFELQHLNKMERIHKVLQSNKEEDASLCNEYNKCSVCVMYGVGSCQSNVMYPPPQSIQDMQHTMNDVGRNVDDVVKKKYLKFKQESERKVMEHKIKTRDNNNNNNSKKKKKSKHKKKEKKHHRTQASHTIDGMNVTLYPDKDQSDADSQYAADLHEQLNKPHLRSRRTRSCSKLQGESPPIKSMNHPKAIMNHNNNNENRMIGMHHNNNNNKKKKNTNAQMQSKSKHKTKTNMIQSVLEQQQKEKRAIIKPHKAPLKNGMAMMNKKHPPKQPSAAYHMQRGNEDIKMKIHKKMKKKKESEHEKHAADIEDVNNIEFCDKCGISKDSLKSKGTWSRHLHSKHTYYCKQCSLQFTTALTLSDHEKATHREKKAKYKWGKGKQKGNKSIKKSKSDKYMERQGVHKDELPEKCIKCGRPRGETPKSHWNKHIQTDHKFPCPHCQYRFAHRKKFNEHLKELHSIKKHNKKNEGGDTTEGGDVVMANTTNKAIVNKKRKYNHHYSTEQPQKRRKLSTEESAKALNEEDMFKNDEYIKALIAERDRELKLYAFVDFEGYQEDEELMVSIYDKMDKNDAKYGAVFEKEEQFNKEIQSAMQCVHSELHSVFNALVFNVSNNPNRCVPPNPSKTANTPQTSASMNLLPTPQPIIIQQQPPISTNKKINNAHFSCNASTMKMSSKSNHKAPPTTAARYAGYNSHKSHHHHHHHHHHHSNTSTPNSSHTPISQTSNSSHSRSNSHCSNTDRRNNSYQASNHYHNNNYHHHKPEHHHHSHHRHHIRYNNTSSYHNTRHNHMNHSTANNYKQDPENKTLFIDNIPIGCTEDALLNALKKTGSIKSILLRTKLNQQSQYANVVCFQKHICESLIDAGKRPIPLHMPSGQIVQTRLSIHYHNQKKVDMAKEKRRKEMAAREQRIKHL